MMLSKSKSVEYTAAEGGVVLCTVEHQKKYKKEAMDGYGYNKLIQVEK